MLSGKKFLFIQALLIILLHDAGGQPGECTSRRKFQYYLHLAHTRTAENPLMDPLAESIDYNYYDMLWLGGDMALSSSLDDYTMDHLDSILDLANMNTLWSLGNHDYADLDRVSAYTNRLPYYAYYKNNITFLVLDTQDSLSNIVGEQLELFNQVTDTLLSTTHLILIHHKLIWMYDNPYLESYINTIPNGGFGDCFYCINPNNFYLDLYPKLLTLEAKGIEVICIAGDIGFRTNEFHYTTPEGVLFLASGIDAYKSYNQALVFRHDLESDSLSWTFSLMTDLLTPPDTALPVFHSLALIQDEIEQGDSLGILIHAEDSLSGIDRIRIDFVESPGNRSFAIDSRLMDWTSLGEDNYIYNLFITDSLAGSTWHVSSLSLTDSAGNVLCLNSGDSLQIDFTVLASTGVPEIKRPELHVYPNPASGIIYWNTNVKILCIEVFSQQGDLLVNYQSPENNIINLGQQAPGLYLIRFTCPGQQVIARRLLIF